MKIKNQIPNFVTLLNLFSGCLAIVVAFEYSLVVSAYLIFIAAVFDFFDGFLARKLHAGTLIGKELDSLADVVSFGIAPAVIMYELLSEGHVAMGIGLTGVNVFPFVAFLLPLFGAYRLARFNVREADNKNFNGLPTPAMAIFIASLPLIQYYQLDEISFVGEFLGKIIFNSYFLLVILIVLSYLMISNIRLMSLKFSDFGWQHNFDRYIFLFVSIILIVLFQFISIPIIILLYVIFSLSIRKR